LGKSEVFMYFYFKREELGSVFSSLDFSSSVFGRFIRILTRLINEEINPQEHVKTRSNSCLYKKN